MPSDQEYYRQGHQAEALGQFEAALKFYRQALKANPDYRPALLNAGAIYSKARQSQKAILLFERALQLEADATVHFNLGSELYRIRDLPGSERHLKQALRLDRRLLRAHLILAHIYREQGLKDKSLIYFQNAFVLDPASRIAALGVVVALSDAARAEEALRICDKFLQAHPADSAFQKLHLGLLLELNRNAEAEAAYSQLARTSSGFTSFSDHLKEARAAGDAEHELLFNNLKDKIALKSHSVRERIAARRAEKKSATAEERQSDIKDLVDLSFLHLFNGEEEKAMKLLFQARKLKGSEAVTATPPTKTDAKPSK